MGASLSRATSFDGAERFTQIRPRRHALRGLRPFPEFHSRTASHFTASQARLAFEPGAGTVLLAGALLRRRDAPEIEPPTLRACFEICRARPGPALRSDPPDRSRHRRDAYPCPAGAHAP